MYEVFNSIPVLSVIVVLFFVLVRAFGYTNSATLGAYVLVSFPLDVEFLLGPFLVGTPRLGLATERVPPGTGRPSATENIFICTCSLFNAMPMVATRNVKRRPTRHPRRCRSRGLVIPMRCVWRKCGDWKEQLVVGEWLLLVGPTSS